MSLGMLLYFDKIKFGLSRAILVLYVFFEWFWLWLPFFFYSIDYMLRIFLLHACRSAPIQDTGGSQASIKPVILTFMAI